MKLILLLLSVCWFSLASWSPVFRNPIHPSTPMQWLDPCSCVPNCTNPTPSPWLEEGNRELTEENLIIWLVDLQYFADEARNYYELFRNKFVRDVFQVDYKTHKNDWSNLEYNWLPKPPKKLGEPTNRGFLEKLELDQFLKDTKRYLEILAVGLEQVVWDHTLDDM
ncbi:uncharacterized protein LOC128988443 [Macrosteles quadrilineatus]|uniref:uncharacterized protein LOC128988443 n=1 Tax=Macrosteles quadrilineatus TaxID=74068 RepID=UPI0023E21CCC|nr:uncharacterized protein LOC128988443 [Macrosteles quadrilineatus]